MQHCRLSRRTGLAALGLLVVVLPWLPRPGGGPRADAQANAWSAVNSGLNGDRIQLLETVGDPSVAPRTALILTEDNGLLRVPGGGQSALPSTLPDGPKGRPTILTFATAPDDATGQRLYAGTNQEPVLLRSTDGGATWEALPPPPSMSRIEYLVALAGGRLLVGSSSLPLNYMYSDDDGKSWVSRSVLAFDATDAIVGLLRNQEGSRAYLRSGASLYASDTGAEPWTKVLAPGLHGLDAKAALTLMAAGQGGRIMVLGATTDADVKNHLIMVSDDGGLNWKPQALPTGIDPTQLIIAGSGGQELAYLGLPEGSILRSDDAGSTWAPVHKTQVDLTGLRVDPADGGLWAATRGAGLYRFGSRTERFGFHLLRMSAVLAPPAASEPVLALARVREAVRGRAGPILVPPLYQAYHLQPGDRWEASAEPLELGETLLPAPDVATSKLIYSGQYRSTDWGRNWTALGDGPDRDEAPFVSAVGPITATERHLYALEQPYRLGTGGTQVMRSENGGASWQLMQPPLGGVVAMAAADDTVFHTVFAITERGVVLRSYDHEAFQEVSQIPAQPPLRNVFGLAVSPQFLLDRTLMVVVEEQRSADRALTYISTDEGETWQPRRTGLAGESRPRGLFLSPDFMLDRTAFIGGYRAWGETAQPGIYRTGDRAAVWRPELNLPEGAEIQGFSLRGSMQAGALYAAAGDGGIWRRNLSEAVPPTVTPTRTPFFPTNTPVPPGFTASPTLPPTFTPTHTPVPIVHSPTPFSTRTATPGPSATSAPGVTPPTPEPTRLRPTPTVGVATPAAGSAFLPSLKKGQR